MTLQQRGWTRRSALGAVAGMVGTALIGCGGDDETATPTPLIRSGSPVADVPEFNDPGRWTGRTLTVAAWGGEVQDALRSMVWEPFGRAVGCIIQEATTDYAQLRRSVASGRPYTDVAILDESTLR